MMKNCEFAEFGSFARAMPTMPRLNGTFENSAGRLGYFEPPVPSPRCAVAGLRHEAGDDAVERHVVVVLFARELLDAFDVLGREVVAQLDDDAAVFGIDQRACSADRRLPAVVARGRAPHRSARQELRSRRIMESPGINGRTLPANFAFRRAATDGGTNCETSPPMDAICRTSVAVIGRMIGDAGRNTVCTSGAMRPVHPRHFHLVVEIGRAAQPADEERRALALGRRDHEIGEGDAGEIAAARAREPDRRSPRSWRGAPRR